MLRNREIKLRDAALHAHGMTRQTIRRRGPDMMPNTKLDPIDRKILAELQDDGRMTNVELARRVGISAPPCLRRVRTLEEAGYIRGYHADVDPRMLGFEVQVFAMVGLSSQAEADLVAFEELCNGWPLVRECHMLNGEIDFILKCVAPDLSTFQSFLTGSLTAAPNVASVRTSLVIRGAKDAPGVPFDVMEDRLSRSA
jgi:DNA-binding Lrp family transcriptional regulator